MDISHLTSQSLRRILALTEKKNTLLKGLEDIETEIARSLTGAASAVQGMGRPVAVFGSVSNGSSRRPGSLKERILNLLEAAGKEGMKVKEIASALRRKEWVKADRFDGGAAPKPPLLAARRSGGTLERLAFGKPRVWPF